MIATYVVDGLFDLPNERLHSMDECYIRGGWISRPGCTFSSALVFLVEYIR
jgi:hypothetical protein